MSISKRCAAVAATAVVAAAAPGTMPEPTVGQSDRTEIALTATTIPIVDIDTTLGPLTVVRRLDAIFDTPTPTALLAALEAFSGTGWAGPLGANADQISNLTLPVEAEWVPGSFADLNFLPRVAAQSRFASFGPIGPVIAGTANANARANPTVYLGGSDGFGVGFIGALGQIAAQSFAELPGAGSAGASINGFVGRIPQSQLTVFSDRGFKAVLDIIPVSGSARGSTTVGSTTISGNVNTTLQNAAALCTGSAVAGCGGMIARDTVVAALSGGITLSAPGVGTIPVSVNLPNQLDVALKPDSLSVTGQVGATLTVGPTTVGRIIPIDVHIPFGSTQFTRSTATRATPAAAGAGAQVAGDQTATPKTPRQHRSRATAGSAKSAQRSSAK